MDNLILWGSIAFLVVIIMIGVVLGATKGSAKKERDNHENRDNHEDYEGLYTQRILLTANERSQYDKLQSAAVKLRLTLFAKVRLADIIEPDKDAKNWQTLFNKVKAKHVDFLLCDRSMKPVCVIEIDDSSHDKENRKQHDKFVDFILQDVGIPTIRKRGVIGSELEAEIAKVTKSVSFAAR